MRCGRYNLAARTVAVSLGRRGKDMSIWKFLAAVACNGLKGEVAIDSVQCSARPLSFYKDIFQASKHRR